MGNKKSKSSPSLGASNEMKKDKLNSEGPQQIPRSEQQAIERHALIEGTIAAISSRFVGLEDIDEAINSSLADMGRISGASRAYLFLFDEAAKTMTNTHEWCAPGVSPQIAGMQKMAMSTFPWWVNKIRDGQTIHLPDVALMPPEAKAEREIFDRQEIRSLLGLPVLKEGRPAGFVGFDNTAETREWSEDEIALLRVAAEIIGAALERRRAEEALRESKQRTEDILESITDGFMALDRQFRLTYVNQRAEEVLGQKRGRLLGRNLWEVFPEARKGAFFREYRAALADQKPVSFEEFYGPLNMWVEVHAYPYKDGLSVYFRDITERKRTEVALGQSESKYRKLMDMANDAIFIADAQTGTIVDANQAAERLIGRPLKEIVGMHQMELHPPEEAENYRRLFQEYIGKIAGVTEEIYALHRSGRKVPVEISSSVMELNGRTVIQGIFRDITERKQAKEQRDIADRLQRAVLAMPEKMPGVRFGHLYRSATGGAGNIGGDFYDLFEPAQSRIAVVIGDVSGKGLEAATLTTLIKDAVRAYAYQGDSPGVIAAKTNDMIYKMTPPSILATLFLGVIDIVGRSLDYTTAGHPPAVLVKESLEAARLKTGPAAIGIFPALDYPDYRQPLAQNDKLFLYTDGLIEGRSGNRFFGEGRLIETVRELAGAQPERLPALIFERLSDFTGGPLADDVALLAVALEA
jgi:PAS domain S-box-containing protein